MRWAVLHREADISQFERARVLASIERRLYEIFARHGGGEHDV